MHSREDRHRSRAELGSLASLRLPDALKLRYETALARYFAFEASNCFTSSSSDELDSTIAEFIEDLWQSGEPRY